MVVTDGIIEVVIGGLIVVIGGGIIEVVLDVKEGVGMWVDPVSIVVGTCTLVDILLLTPKAHELVKSVQVTKDTTEKSIFPLSKRALFEPKERL